MLGAAHALSSAALSLFIVALAGATGGVSSPLLLWLAVVPVEAAFLGSRGFMLRAVDRRWSAVRGHGLALARGLH